MKVGCACFRLRSGRVFILLTPLSTCPSVRSLRFGERPPCGSVWNVCATGTAGQAGRISMTADIDVETLKNPKLKQYTLCIPARQSSEVTTPSPSRAAGTASGGSRHAQSTHFGTVAFLGCPLHSMLWCGIARHSTMLVQTVISSLNYVGPWYDFSSAGLGLPQSNMQRQAE